MFLNLLQNVSGALKNNPRSWTSLILWASLRKDKARIQSSSQLQRYLWQCFLENLVNSLYDPQMSAETETRSSPQASKLSCCTDEACLFLFLLPVGIQIHIVFISAGGGEKKSAESELLSLPICCTAHVGLTWGLRTGMLKERGGRMGHTAFGEHPSVDTAYCI